MSSQHRHNNPDRRAHHVEREVLQAGQKRIVFRAENVDDEFLHQPEREHRLG